MVGWLVRWMGKLQKNCGVYESESHIQLRGIKLGGFREGLDCQPSQLTIT